jgi:transcriptional regulator with XRE-family HTH domain
MQSLTTGDAIAAREMLNLSQAKVARDIGLNRPYLSQFEGGKRILEDRWQQSLREYYISMGWEPEGDEGGGEPASAAPHSPAPLIRDGFVIAETAAEGDLEGLLEEYYESSRLIEELGRVKLKRGFFGGLDEDSALEQTKQYFVLTAKLCAIRKQLHGHTGPDNREYFAASDFSTITTVGDYVDYLIEASPPGAVQA